MVTATDDRRLEKKREARFNCTVFNRSKFFGTIISLPAVRDQINEAFLNCGENALNYQ